MVYNSVLIEGPQEQIDAIDSLIMSKETLMEDLYPDFVQNKILWKRANWGIGESGDFYLNRHHSAGRVVIAAIMVGFEADGNALLWLQKVAKKFKKVDFQLEVSDMQSDDYRVMAKFSNGERCSAQLTLF